MSKHFRAWPINEVQLLPARVQDYVASDHLSRLIVSLVEDSLDLSAIESGYRSGLGQPPFDPRLMTALLLHGHASGLYASRRIARACVERTDFMMIVAGDPPDCRTISEFRRRNLTALAGLLVQVLKLAEKAGLVRLGHVALAGTRIKANASRHKAMSDERMKKREAELQAEVDRWLAAAEAEAADREEDQLYGDQAQLALLLDGLRANLGRNPDEASADAGYCSATNLRTFGRRRIAGYIIAGRQKHGTSSATGKKPGTPGSLIARVTTRLKRAGHRNRYRLRQQIVEPVFGQIKQARGFRQFLLRGIDKVTAEWAIVCTAHNLNKQRRAA